MIRRRQAAKKAGTHTQWHCVAQLNSDSGSPAASWLRRARTRALWGEAGVLPCLRSYAPPFPLLGTPCLRAPFCSCAHCARCRVLGMAGRGGGGGVAAARGGGCGVRAGGPSSRARSIGGSCFVVVFCCWGRLGLLYFITYTYTHKTHTNKTHIRTHIAAHTCKHAQSHATHTRPHHNRTLFSVLFSLVGTVVALRMLLARGVTVEPPTPPSPLVVLRRGTREGRGRALLP